MRLPTIQKRSYRNPSQDEPAVDLLCLHKSRLVRSVLLGVGILALALAILGVVLPVLPTTPFVILAAYCFARSSARFHRMLLTNRIAGHLIHEWCRYHSISRSAKRWAYLLMTLSFGSSILFVPEFWHKIMLLVIGLILAIFIWRVPVREPKTS